MISFNNKLSKVLSEAFIEPGIDLAMDNGITKEVCAELFDIMNNEIGGMLRRAEPYIEQKADELRRIVVDDGIVVSGRNGRRRILRLLYVAMHSIRDIVQCIDMIHGKLESIQYSTLDNVVYDWITQFTEISGRIKKSFSNIAAIIADYDAEASQHFLLLAEKITEYEEDIDKIVNGFNLQGRNTLINTAEGEFYRKYDNEDDALRDLLSARSIYWMKLVGPRIMKSVVHQYPDYGCERLARLLSRSGDADHFDTSVNNNLNDITSITAYWPVTLQQVYDRCIELHPNSANWLRPALELANEQYSLGLT